MKVINVIPFVKRVFSRLLNGQSGSAVVELAIVFPILLLLFVGTAELGRLFYTYTTLAKATKVGARYLSNQRDAVSSDANTILAVKAAAQSLVVCGYTSCTGNQPDGTPKKPIVPGLDMANPGTNVLVTLPATGVAGPRYVKVEIQNYTFQPGVFNIAGATGSTSSTFYFPLTPGIQMRYVFYPY
jgi:Flp pilus assembly protein TadG